MRPLTVVIVNDFAHVQGGASQVAIQGAIALAERGHQVHFVSAVGPVSAALQAKTRVWCTEQAEIAADPRRLRAAVQGLWNFKSARLLAQVLNGLQPHADVVHVHGWTKALSSAVFRVARQQRVPLVATFHDYFSVCPNGGFFRYPQNEPCHLVPLSAACIGTQCDKAGYSQKLWRVMRQLVQMQVGCLPQGLSACMVPSDFSRAILHPYLPENIPVHLHPNIIGVERAAPIDVGLNRTFVMVGRLSREKGPDVFARASRTLIPPFRSLFVGDGDCRSEILAIDPQATITGWCGPADVRRHLSGARALVFPSRIFEVQPLAVLEAAALGIPAIVADSSAARDQVVDGETGLWFRSGDADDLARKLDAMAGDIAIRMGRAAYETYWKRPLTPEVHAVGLERIYESLLSTP